MLTDMFAAPSANPFAQSRRVALLPAKKGGVQVGALGIDHGDEYQLAGRNGTIDDIGSVA